MVEIIHTEPTKIKNHNGVARATIPIGWQPVTKLKPEKKAERALLEGKHGIFYGLWVEDNQPSSDELDEQKIRKAIIESKSGDE